MEVWNFFFSDNRRFANLRWKLNRTPGRFTEDWFSFWGIKHDSCHIQSIKESLPTILSELHTGLIFSLVMCCVWNVSLCSVALMLASLCRFAVTVQYLDYLYMWCACCSYQITAYESCRFNIISDRDIRFINCTMLLVPMSINFYFTTL